MSNAREAQGGSPPSLPEQQRVARVATPPSTQPLPSQPLAQALNQTVALAVDAQSPSLPPRRSGVPVLPAIPQRDSTAQTPLLSRAAVTAPTECPGRLRRAARGPRRSAQVEADGAVPRSRRRGYQYAGSRHGAQCGPRVRVRCVVVDVRRFQRLQQPAGPARPACAGRSYRRERRVEPGRGRIQFRRWRQRCHKFGLQLFRHVVGLGGDGIHGHGLREQCVLGCGRRHRHRSGCLQPVPVRQEQSSQWPAGRRWLAQHRGRRVRRGGGTAAIG